MTWSSSSWLLAVGLALALVGCGGGGELESGASTPTQPTAGSQTVNGGRTSPVSPNSGSPKASEASKPPPNLPPPTPGSKAAAPGVPTSREGDNSIQTWGLEASAAERQEAGAIARRYLDARAAGNWSTVCRLLAAKTRREQSRYASGASCPKAMTSFAASSEGSTLREEAEIEVLSFRVAKKYAFLIYRRPGGIFATALSREGGEWKLVSVTSTPVQ